MKLTPEQFDTWFPRLGRAAVLALGITIELYELVLDDGQRFYLISAGVGLIGAAVAGTIEKLATKRLEK